MRTKKSLWRKRNKIQSGQFKKFINKYLKLNTIYMINKMSRVWRKCSGPDRSQTKQIVITGGEQVLADRMGKYLLELSANLVSPPKKKECLTKTAAEKEKANRGKSACR